MTTQREFQQLRDQESRGPTTRAGLWAAIALSALTGASVTGCTKLLPSQFLLQQQQQTFTGLSTLNVNTKIDMLWVVDNSSSMDPDQQKLRAGFAAFAQEYMQPTWDIRVAAIPTDAYLANPIYTTYLSSVIPQSGGAKDPYIAPLVTSGKYTVPTNNSYWNASETKVVNMNTGDYNPNGVTINQLVPSWGPDYAKLLPGIHDGPVAGLCSSFMPYFLKTEPDCAIRDSRAQTGTTDCLNPTGTESSVTQCVNTVQNDTVHSGLPIVSTMPPSGTPGDQAWVDTLINNFIVNLTTGTAGSGAERGLGSVLQFLNDNEASGSATSFFRPGSLRVIVFISDEDDQTMNYDALDTTYSASDQQGMFSHYQCDLSGLENLNGGAASFEANFPTYCCSGGSCTYGTDGTTCPSKTILNDDGSDYTYTVSTCPNPNDLMPVSTVKAKLDSFFEQLDTGLSTPTPNYFTYTITGLTGNSIQSLQAIHTVDDANAGAPAQVTADRADRYIDLGNLVAPGSQNYADITSSDYTPILDAIGNQIIQQEGTFTLAYPPTNQQEMTVSILHADGSSTVLQNSQYTISGSTLTITDLNLILSLQSTDQIVINYQPATSYTT